MSTSLFFSQLKTFCYEAEQDAKKLRKQVDMKSEADMVDYGFLDNMGLEVQELQKKLRKLEVTAYDTSSTEEQFSMIRADEIQTQCQTLFDVNQQMISTMEAHLQQFGYKPVPKLAKGYSSIDLNQRQERNKEIGSISYDEDKNKENYRENVIRADDNVCESPQQLNASFSSIQSADHTRKEFESPVNVGLFREDANQDAKTPVLSEWKFSSSTKHLLTQRDLPHNYDAEADKEATYGNVSAMDLSYSESPSTETSQKVQPDKFEIQQGRPSVASSDSSLNLSPSNLEMSYDWSSLPSRSHVARTSSQTNACSPVSHMNKEDSTEDKSSPEIVSHIVSSPETPKMNGVLKTAQAKAPLLTTSTSTLSYPSPQRQATSHSENDCDYNSDCSDPGTPELPELSVSTAKYKLPFHRSAAKSASKKRGNRIQEGHSQGDKDNQGAVVEKLQYNDEGDASSDEEGSDNDMDIDEIDTSTRLLQPRRTAGGGTGPDGKEGWIPMVSQEEWTSAPSFLKMQVTVETLNTALQQINKSIEEVNARGVCKGHLESFSVTEIEEVVGGNHVDKTPVKTIILGLVHLKRLDICTENSIKVYKVRRFY